MAVDPVRAEIQTILMPNEDVIYIAHQDQKAPTVKKAAAVVTDHRLILYKPGMIGSANFWDRRWADIQDVHLKQGMMWSDFTVRTTSGESAVIEKMNKAEAQQLYSLCQQKEHEWKEHRRQRELEDARARAGGVVIQAPSQQPVAPAAAPAEDPMAKLQRAKQMLDNGLITQAEYDEVKNRILSQM